LQDVLYSPFLKRLRTLDLRGCGVRHIGAHVVATAQPLTALRRLLLSGNAVGDVGARALAESPHLGGLEVLDLRDSGTRLKPATVEARRARFGGRVLL